MSLHKNLTAEQIHIPYSYSYADATERTGASGFVSADVGKFAIQLDNKSIWVLADTSPTWNELSGLSSNAHETLRQLIHFIDNGPAEGFASGSYRETIGGIFPTSIIWYDQAGVGKKKIVEKNITWAGAFPTIIEWKIYDTLESLLATVTDTITYSGAFEISRTRTIS